MQHRRIAVSSGIFTHGSRRLCICRFRDRGACSLSAVKSELGLTSSMGIARNKMMAKLASGRAKPNGVAEVLTITMTVPSHPDNRLHACCGHPSSRSCWRQDSCTTTTAPAASQSKSSSEPELASSRCWIRRPRPRCWQRCRQRECLAAAARLGTPLQALASSPSVTCRCLPVTARTMATPRVTCVGHGGNALRSSCF